MWPLSCANVICTSQLLESLGGCQLEPHSPKHKLEPTSVVTKVFKCGCGKVSREQCPPSEEYALLLEVTMADCPGCLCPPVFSWNAGIVMHVLKCNPTLRDLEHIQVDSPGTAYLFFFDKQGRKGLTLDAAQTLMTHMGEALAEWISHSAHFTVILLPLAEGWLQAVAAPEWCCQRCTPPPAQNQKRIFYLKLDLS